MAEEKINDMPEAIIEIELERLKAFRDHPFQVKDDKQMALLKESIEKYGILNPLIVRPKKEGYYEIISGHRRIHIAKELGYRKVPVIIRVLNDTDAVISMVDSNVQREMLLPSEKAFAYKMKNEAMKHAGRISTKGQVVHNYEKGKKTIDYISEECGESPKQIQRYIRLTYLIPELLKKVDAAEIGMNTCVQLAYIKSEEQKMVWDMMEYLQTVPSLSQANKIKDLSREGKLTKKAVKDILSEIKKGDPTRVMFKNEDLYKFFPRSYTPEKMKREIMAMLKGWLENYKEEQAHV